MKARNEIFDGKTRQDNYLISEFLEAKRDKRPAIFNSHAALSDFLANEDIPEIDPLLFMQIINEAETYFGAISPDYIHLPVDRYFVRIPDPDDRGGFHGQKKYNKLNPGGYWCLDDYGFGTLLNPDVVPDIKLRTYELARNYLHDSMHASTFRSFRASEDGSVYRFQYGVNFRDEQGHGYSPTKASLEKGTVNLNIMMEGLIQKLIGEFMTEHAGKNGVDYNDPEDFNLTDIERLLWDDIVLSREDFSDASDINTFHKYVMKPTLNMLRKWDPDDAGLEEDPTPLKERLFHAMMSGDMRGVHRFFDIKLYGEDKDGLAWENLFRQKSFDADMSRSPMVQTNNEAYEFVCIPPFGYVRRDQLAKRLDMSLDI